MSKILSHLRSAFAGAGSKPDRIQRSEEKKQHRDEAPVLYRHGDVLILGVADLPSTAEPSPGSVLVQGEATGHSHRIAERARVQRYRDVRQIANYLEIKGEAATLVHEEHAPIVLQPGYYRYWRQREYTPERIRTVVD